MCSTLKKKSLSQLFIVYFQNNRRATEGNKCEINMITSEIHKDHPGNSAKTLTNELDQKVEDQVAHSGSHKIQSGC